MPLIKIGELITFAPNMGVLVHKEALQRDPQAVFSALELAWQHMKDDELRRACLGGEGELAQYAELQLVEYLEIREAMRDKERTAAVKRTLTKVRRAVFNIERVYLILAILATGTPYICAKLGCREAVNLSLDHIVPLSRGGTDQLSNLQFLCRHHNSEKGAKTA